MDIYIFSKELELIGHTDVVTSGLWTENFAAVGTFEFWSPLDAVHAELFQEGNLVYMLEHKSAGVIELIEKESSDKDITMHIAGRHLKSYLDRRCVYPVFNKTAKPSEIARSLVNVNCINPTDKNRVIPNLSLKADDPEYGTSMSMQKTGGSVLDAEVDFLTAQNLGSEVIFDYKNKKLLYSVRQGTDRSIDQDVNDPVLLSTDMDTILSSEYTYDKSEVKNFAYVAGAGEGADRKVISVSNSTLSGLDRYELYVDARDIQNTKTDDTGTQTTIPDAEYNSMLSTRGLSKLAECKLSESFEATIRTDELAGFIFDKDYFLGDTITVYDNRLKVKADVLITAVEYKYTSEGQEVNLTLGYPQLSVMQKLRRDTKQ